MAHLRSWVAFFAHDKATYHCLFSEFPGEADPHNARDRDVQNLNPNGGGSADP